MNCGMECIKYLLFIFNFIFALCGLAILACGVLVHLNTSYFSEAIHTNVTFPAVALIVVGTIIFVIAFFGCCGAIRESHCMTVAFAVLMLTILIIQVAVAVFAFIVLKDVQPSELREGYEKVFDKYSADETTASVVDTLQKAIHCCGVDGYKDFETRVHMTHLPSSCCSDSPNATCTDSSPSLFKDGCVTALKRELKRIGEIVGGLAIGIGAVEVIGIVFALCLANSIKNAERRGYRV